VKFDKTFSLKLKEIFDRSTAKLWHENVTIQQRLTFFVLSKQEYDEYALSVQLLTIQS
jgi:hypothetical protein